MSRRTQQVSSLLARSIQDVISRGLHDPRISGLITVTGVDVLQDLSTAIVHFTVIPVERESLVRHGLQGAAGHIRRELGEKVRMRRVPNLTFKIDVIAKEQAKVLGAIAKARAEFDDDSPPGETVSGDAETNDASSDTALPWGKSPPGNAIDGEEKSEGGISHETEHHS